jgi:hypothetical protein
VNRRSRELKAVMSTAAEACGAELVAIEPTRGGHRRARFRSRSGEDVFVISSSSPSDFRSLRNALADARRRLRA